ncbi:MAG: 50S ribosomal protein L10 [Candidatus Saccharibacteria bacterium]|nr:50S ribosomal protein L10 [Candidatus Saccharibacteria bacterium]
MALTKAKKKEVVEEVSQLLKDSKMTIIASYQGTPVKAMQALRAQGRENGTELKVIKNRLVIQALKDTDSHKDADTSALEGMLLYAFNEGDEVAPAQTIANFAKKQKTLQFVGAYTADGKFLPADEVRELSELPSQTQLIAQVMSTLSSPLDGSISGLADGLSGILSGLEEKAAN